MSLTVYGGPDDGRYSTRIVGSANSQGAERDADGAIHIVISPKDPVEPGVAWIRLEPDAVAAITRTISTTRGWVGGPPGTSRPTNRPRPTGRMTPTWRGASGPLTTWVREQASIVPIPLGTPNAIDPPYPVPTTTFGWAAGDAAYAMGAFELADDEALVIRAVPPSACSGTCACGTGCSTPTTTTTNG